MSKAYQQCTDLDIRLASFPYKTDSSTGLDIQMFWEYKCFKPIFRAIIGLLPRLFSLPRDRTAFLSPLPRIIPREQKGRIMKRASTLGFCTICIFLIAAPFLRAQDKTRTLEFGAYRRYDISTEPVAIVRKELGNKIFRESPGESKVIAGSDWLHELTLSFKNISSKSIQAFEAHLIVPKQGNMSEIGTVVLRFPFESILDPDAKTSNQMLKLWKSGQVISMKIPISKLRLLDNLKIKGVYDIDMVSIAIYRIEFDDRTGWFQGMKTRENPDLPGNWIPERPMSSSNSVFK